MKFLGFEIKKEKKVSIDEYQSYSTPFGQVGKGNLSLPYVNTNYKGGGGYIRFGNDNLYPQLLTQLYYVSPLHSSICNFIQKATTGGGYELTLPTMNNKEKFDYLVFEKKTRLAKLIPSITLDLIVHKRVYFEIHKSGKLSYISADKIRTNTDKSCYYISNDWSTGAGIRTINPYKENSNEECQLYCYEPYSLGQDIYPIPSYTSANNWIFLDGEMSYLHKSNIQNSIFPSFALMFPKKFQTEEEKQGIKDAISGEKGAGKAGNVLVMSANGKELLPEITAIPTNQNDKLFIETDEQVNLKICQAHTIDPMLMGVRVSGKLGGGSDIKQAYIIFEKNVVMPLRAEVEEIVNDLLRISELKPIFKLNNFQIINESIIEK